MASTVKYVEILTTQTRKNLDLWKFHGPVMMTFDENTKGYVLDCNGGSMSVPKNHSKPLKLIRPYLLMQIFLYPGKLLTLELSVTDSQGAKRRIMLTQCKTVVNNMMHSRLPNSFIEKNSWTHLYINVFSLFSMSFPTSTFRSLDGLSLSAFCKLRRIYSLSEMDIDYLLPSGFELPKYIQTKTQVINSDSFSHFNQHSQSTQADQSLSNPSHKSQKASSLSLPKIAIGKKQNIFYDNNLKNLRNSIQDMQKEYMKGANLGAKQYFRKQVPEESENFNIRLKEKMKKITHIHYKETNEGEIEENIEIDEKSADDDPLVKQIRGISDPRFEVYQTPDFFEANLKSQLEPRHVTPPFTNLKGSLVYNPRERSYENSPNL